MSVMSADWTEAARRYAGECRERRPLTVRGEFPPEHERRCMIEGGFLFSFLRDELPYVLRQRRFFGLTAELDPQPLVVLTADMPGLVAAHEILSPVPDRCVLLLDEELPALEARLPKEYAAHVHCWSRFTDRVDERTAAEAAGAGREVRAADCRLHVTGVMWGPRMGRQVEHLWRWNGRELELVKEAVRSEVY